MKKARVGINGFGRIGRIAARILLQRKSLEFAAINSRADATSHAYLLKNDSTYGAFEHDIKPEKNTLLINGKKVMVYQQIDPLAIPWHESAVDIVVDCTGAFRTRELAGKHLKAGAKKVIISAPAKDDMPTFCFGVNHSLYHQDQQIISNASCTTNCLAPVLNVLHNELDIQQGNMTTIHAYTDSQNLLDNSHKKDLRLTRSAVSNMIPTETGAGNAIGKVIPALQGKIITSAIRIPLETVSLIDLTVIVKKTGTRPSIIKIFENAAATTLNGVLSVSHGHLVSSDLKGSTFSAVVDAPLLKVDDHIVNVKAWYDNEWGYVSRLIDMLEYIAP